MLATIVLLNSKANPIHRGELPLIVAMDAHVIRFRGDFYTSAYRIQNTYFYIMGKTEAHLPDSWGEPLN